MRHRADARTSLHLDRFVLYRQGEQHGAIRSNQFYVPLAWEDYRVLCLPR